MEAVAVKLPILWISNLNAWFQQAEAQFVLHNMTTSETRYFYVVSVLDAPTAVRVAPFLLKLRTPNGYTELKTLLLDTFGLSDDERARSFSSITDLGDRHPSEVMDRMLLLLGWEEPNFLL